MSAPIRQRDRDTIIQALAAGVVPRIGLQHIQVGRANELTAAAGDIKRISDGGCAVRFVTGDYGSGKTFFTHVVRHAALHKNLVTLHADLAPDRRIHATGGQARNLYIELLRNLSTMSSPDGNALLGVVQRFIGKAAKLAADSQIPLDAAIDQLLAPLHDHVGGFDYATVIKAYAQAHDQGDQVTQDATLRWLRGEYANRTAARQAIGVRTVVDDGAVYDWLKLLAAFVQIADYAGLLIILDEMVNIYKIQNRTARDNNYEQILRITNDVLQGNGQGFGFYFAGTVDSLEDERRGIYSYDALKSRLSQNRFATDGRIDLSGPVLKLTPLTPEDLHLLLENIRNVFASGDNARWLVPDTALNAFMDHCYGTIGDAYFRTPRNTIREFVQLLAVLEQNPDTQWQTLIGDIKIETDHDGSLLDEPPDDGGTDDLTPLPQ